MLVPPPNPMFVLSNNAGQPVATEQSNDQSFHGPANAIFLAFK